MSVGDSLCVKNLKCQLFLSALNSRTSLRLIVMIFNFPKCLKLIFRLILYVIYIRRRLITNLIVFIMVVQILLYFVDVPCPATQMHPPRARANLEQFKRSRRLKNYVSELLIEPSRPVCTGTPQLIALVASGPHRLKERAAIRSTWGKKQPTFFFIGLASRNVSRQFRDNYFESKDKDDLIVGDFTDSRENSTIKTAYMIKWTLRRCPWAEFVLKIEDDALLNPWTMKRVLRRHADANLIGYRHIDSVVSRERKDKLYMPNWLYENASIPEHLSGAAYLIKATCLRRIYTKATFVPMVNLEDVYFTYLVAKESLGLTLTHDSLISPYRPLLTLNCAYWSLATMHSICPEEMLKVWHTLEYLSQQRKHGETVCRFHVNYIHSDKLLYSNSN